MGAIYDICCPIFYASRFIFLSTSNGVSIYILSDDEREQVF